MPHIPVAGCAACKLEMKPKENGLSLAVYTRDATPYYVINTDEWECPGCGRSVYIGFAKQPISEHSGQDFEQLWANVDSVFFLR